MLNKVDFKHFSIIAFIGLAIVYLPLVNADLLFSVQEYSLFVNGSTFMNETIGRYGVWAWLGCFFTQFFYYPWAGSALLISIWVISYYLLVKAFGLHREWTLVAILPFCALLWSIIEVGYWLYYMKNPGYFFSYSLMYLLASFAAWGIKRCNVRYFSSPLALAIIMIAILTVNGMNLPSFVHLDYKDWTMGLPIEVAKWSTLLFAFPYEKFRVINTVMRLLEVAFILLLTTITNITNVSDKNFHSELKMYVALDECRYDDVIKKAKTCDGTPTNLMVLYKNIALMHTGRLSEMFKINNCGGQPNADEHLRVKIAQQAGEMVYYQFGQVNYSYRWAIENGTRYGLNVTRLKMLVRCAMLNGEFDVAYKYITQLKSTLFHKKWAKEREAMLRDSNRFMGNPEFADIMPLMDDVNNYLDIDEGLCEKWLLDHFSDIRKAKNAKLQELLMCASLWIDDEYAYLVHFYDYYQSHQKDRIPDLYQEALILLANSEESPLTLNDFPFDNTITDKYNRFVQYYQDFLSQGLDNKAIGVRLKSEFGDTYWWYYYFYNDFVIY